MALAASTRAAGVLLESPRAFPYGVAGSAAPADYDRDGDTDVALGIVFAGQGIRVLENDGTGNLSLGFEWLSIEPESIHAIDANGDGWPDIVGDFGRQIPPLFFINDQAGGFELISPGPIADTGLLTLAVLDMDGDGDDDIAFVPEFALGIIPFLSDGAGGFAKGAEIPTAFPVSALAAADLNGDGRKDLLTISNVAAEARFALAGGGFGDPQPIPGANVVTAIELLDLDGDAAQDFALHRSAGFFPLSVYRGTIGGTPEQVDSFEVSYAVASVGAYDVDRDGTRDLIVSAGTGRPDWHARVGDGFEPRGTLPIEGFSLAEPFDPDRDGRTDLLVGGGNSESSTALLSDRATGTCFPQFRILPEEQRVRTRSVVVDLFGDDRAEIVTAGLDRIFVHRHDEAGAFVDTLEFPMPQTTFGSIDFGAVDADGDGDQDIYRIGANGSPQIEVFLNDGVGGLAATPVVSGIPVGRLPHFASITPGAQESILAPAGDMVFVHRPVGGGAYAFEASATAPLEVVSGLRAAFVSSPLRADLLHMRNGVLYRHPALAGGGYGAAVVHNTGNANLTAAPVVIPGASGLSRIALFGSVSDARALLSSDGGGSLSVSLQPLEAIGTISPLEGTLAANSISVYDSRNGAFGAMALSPEGEFGASTLFAVSYNHREVHLGRIDADEFPDAVTIRASEPSEIAIAFNRSGDTTPPVASTTAPLTAVGGAIEGTVSATDAGVGVQFATVYRLAETRAWEPIAEAVPAGGAWSYTPAASGVYRFASVARDYLGNVSALPEPGGEGVVTVAFNAAENAPFTHDLGAAGEYVFPMRDGANVVVTAPAGLGGERITVERIPGAQEFPGQSPDGFAPMLVRISATGAAATTPMPIRVEFAEADLGAFPAESLGAVYRRGASATEAIAATREGSALLFVATPQGDFVPGAAGALGHGWLIGGE